MYLSKCTHISSAVSRAFGFHNHNRLIQFRITLGRCRSVLKMIHRLCTSLTYKEENCLCPHCLLKVENAAELETASSVDTAVNITLTEVSEITHSSKYYSATGGEPQ